MQGNERIFFLGVFCIMVISFYPASSQYHCYKGEVALNADKKTDATPNVTEKCTDKVTFCMTEDGTEGNYKKLFGQYNMEFLLKG